jgi:hypothetical protein
VNLLSLLAPFSPAQRLARTAEEREAIYRFSTTGARRRG